MYSDNFTFTCSRLCIYTYKMGMSMIQNTIITHNISLACEDNCELVTRLISLPRVGSCYVHLSRVYGFKLVTKWFLFSYMHVYMSFAKITISSKPSYSSSFTHLDEKHLHEKASPFQSFFSNTFAKSSPLLPLSLCFSHILFPFQSEA